MKLILNEEQQMLRDSAKDFAENRTPVNHFRSLRDNNNAQNWDKDVWQEMVDLGWSGILIPEVFVTKSLAPKRSKHTVGNPRDVVSIITDGVSSLTLVNKCISQFFIIL